MRKIVVQIFIVVILLSLVSCGYGNENAYFEDVMYEKYVFDIETSMLRKTDSTSRADTQKWQEAYTILLQEYYEMTSHLPAEKGWLFTLHDINGDGVPELIIWESVVSFFFAAHSVYTFFDGEAELLEIAEGFGGNPASLSIFSRHDNIPGIIVSGSGELFRRYMLVSMEGNSLSIDICFTVTTLPWVRGYDDILYYIRGLHTVTTKLPVFLYWLEEEHERMISEGYVLVSELVFYKLHDAVFGFLPVSERPHLHPLTGVERVITSWE